MFFTPQLQVPGEGQLVHRDIGAGLFDRKGQSPQFLGQLLSVRGVIGRLPPAFVGPGQQIFDRICNVEHVERQFIHCVAPLRPPAREEDMPAAKLVEQFLSGERGLNGIQVVEDQQPAGMRLQPRGRGEGSGLFLGDRLFGQIQRSRPT